MTNIFQPYLDAKNQLKLTDVPEMTEFCQLIPNEEFLFSGCEINPKDGGFEVVGTSSLFKSSEPKRITLLATPNSAGYKFNLSGVLPPDWQIGTGFGKLPGSWNPSSDGTGLLTFGKSIFDDIEIRNAQFTILSHINPEASQAQGINLSGDLILKDDFIGKSKGFMSIPPSMPMTGTVNLHNYGQPVIDLNCSINGELSLGHLQAKNLFLKVTSPAPNGWDMTATGIRIGGTIGIGTEGTNSHVVFKLVATVVDPKNSWVLSFQDLEQSVSLGNGIGLITELANLEVDMTSLPEPLKALEKLYLKEFNLSINPTDKTVQGINFKVGLDTTWNLIPGQKFVAIKDPYIGVTISNPKSTTYRVVSYNVGGAFLLGENDTTINVTAHPTQNFEVNGKLDQGDNIHLRDALSHFVSYDNIPDLVITSLSFRANRDGELFLQGGFDVAWHITFTYSFDFSITDAIIIVEKNQSDYNAYFQGNLALDDFSFRVTARYTANAWNFTGYTNPGTNIPLGKAVTYIGDKLGTEIPADLAELDLTNLFIEFNTGTKFFRFQGVLAAPLTIPMGPASKAITLRADISSSLHPTTKKRIFKGQLFGEFDIGDAKFIVSLGIGSNNNYVRGTWIGQNDQTVGMKEFLTAFKIDYTIPSEVDLRLTKATFEYNISKEQFAVSAASKTHGDAFIVAGKGASGTWGVAFGLNLHPNTNLEAIGGNEGTVLRSISNIFTIQQAGVMVATTKFENFSMPVLPVLKNSKNNSSQQTGTNLSKPILPKDVLTVEEGISLAIVVDFASSSNVQAKSMHTIVKQDTLVLQSTFKPNNLTEIKIFAELDGSIGIPAGKHSSLMLANPMFNIDIDTDIVKFGVQGEIKFNIDKEMLDATASVSISETALEVSLDLAAETGSLPAPMGLKGLHLENIGAEMGVYFEPPGVDLGLTGKFRIGEPQAGPDDSFGFVLELVEEVPNPLYLSFNLAKISFAEVITVFTDKDPSQLPSVFSAIEATDVSFYWADSIVVLPDGTMAQPGFGFSGNVNIFGFEAHASLEVGVTKGIHGIAEMAPMHIKGIINITGDGKGITDNYQKEGSTWVKKSNTRIKKLPADTKTKQEIVVEPGGPQFMFSSSGPTYLDVDWKITLFGAISEEVKAKITDKGFEFELQDKLSDIAGITLKCTLKDKDNFLASARLWLDLDAHIGPIKILGVDFGTIHLDTHLKGFIGIVLNPNEFSLKINGSFEFDGHSLTLPELELTVAPASLTELPKAILKHIEDEAEHIFKEVFDDVKKVFDDAKKEVEKIGKDIGEEAVKVEHAAAQEVKKIGDDVKQAVHNIDQAAHAVAQEAHAVEQEAAQIATEATEEVAKVGREAEKEAEKIGQEAEKIAQDAVKDVEKIGKAALAVVKEFGNEVKKVFDAAEHEVAQIASAVAHEAEKIIGDAKKLASEFIDEAAKVASAIEHEAEKVFNEVKELAERAAHAIEHAAKKVWHALKHY